MKTILIAATTLLVIAVSGCSNTKYGCTQGGIKDGKCASSLVRLDTKSGALNFKEVDTRSGQELEWVLQPPLCRPGENLKYGANCTPEDVIVWGKFDEWRPPKTSVTDRGGWTIESCINTETAFYTSPAAIRANPSLSFSDMQKGVKQICQRKASQFDACVAGVDRRFDNSQIAHCKAQLQAIE